MKLALKRPSGIKKPTLPKIKWGKLIWSILVAFIIIATFLGPLLSVLVI